jgi:hypothetical protein
MKYWEIIARNLKKRGWSLGYVSAVDSEGRTIWIADTHRGDGKPFVVRADEKLTAFVEFESAIRRKELERRPKSQPYVGKSKIGSKGLANRGDLIREP